MDEVVETVAVCASSGSAVPRHIQRFLQTNEAAGAPKEHAEAQTADRCKESTAIR